MKTMFNVFNCIVGMMWLLSAMCLDSVSDIPFIVCFICTLYLGTVFTLIVVNNGDQ